MSPHLLVLAATVKVAVPAFTVDQAPGAFSTLMSNEVARVIEAQACGTAMAASQFPEELASSFRLCASQSSCLIVAGRGVGIDVVLAGHVKKNGEAYAITLTPLDARAGRARPAQQLVASGKPSDIVKIFAGNPDTLCQAIDPDWKPVVRVVARQETPAPPAVTTAPADDDAPLLPDFDLPDLPEKPATPAPAEVASKTEVTATPPAPVVVTPEPEKPAAPTLTPPSEMTKQGLVAPAVPADLTGPTREVKVAPVQRRIPWVLVTGGGALLAGAVGLGLGISSHSIWSEDVPIEQNGVVRHSINHAQALQANRLAIGANVLFGVAGALGITTGVLIISNGGLGLGGKF